MTIYKELLDYTVPLPELTDRASSRLTQNGLQHLCQLFGLAIYGTKPKLAKRLVDHLASSLHPRFREFQLLAPPDQYEQVLTEVENYLYSKTKDPNDTSPQPLIFTEMPAIESLLGKEEDQELESGSESDSNIDDISSSTHLRDSYEQFCILYLLEQLEQGHRPNINGFKNYLIKEASILFPERSLIQEVYNSLTKSLKTRSSIEEKIQYLQQLLPSISRSPSRSPEREETVERPSLKVYLYRYLLEMYKEGKPISIQNAKSYLKHHQVTDYTSSIIEQTYSEIQQQLLPYKFDKPKKEQLVQTLLQTELGETSADEEPEVIEEEIVQLEVSPEIEVAEPLELPPSVLEEAVEAPEVCNILESHSTLEVLAEDLSCSGSKVCDVDRQVCVEATPEIEVMTLEIGDKTIPITGKTDSDVIRDIKREIVTLTTQIQRQERSQREKMLELKKFISTPVDLDKLWSSLRSFQSSQQLYTQRKVQQANQELREKMKKCLFV